MPTRTSRTTAALLLLCSAAPVAAAEIETERFYVGGGVSANDLDGEDAGGHQVFAGYELPFQLGRADTAIEVGYHEAGDFEFGPPGRRGDEDIAGVWANGVAAFPLTDQVDVIGRLGVDFGDDDGLMAGGGLAFELPRHFELRGEYVLRDRTDSLQANLLYRF